MVSASRDEPVTSSCPVCGSRDEGTWYRADLQDVEQVSFSYRFSPHHNKTFQVLWCRACTHAYCFPIPENIAGHYRNVVDEEYLRHEASRTLSAEAVLRLVRSGGAAGRLLDVGCATGDLLVAAERLGFQPEGLELSDWSAGDRPGAGLRGAPGEPRNPRPALATVL